MGDAGEVAGAGPAPAWLQALRRAGIGGGSVPAQPHAEASAASSVAPLFDWRSLEPILEAASDVVVACAGKPIPMPAPREVIEVRALLRSGIGMVIRRAEKTSEALSSLAAAVEEQVGAAVHAQLFVTPANSHSFGWHYDFEHVLIAQTAGSKDYYFRENTVDLDTSPQEQPDFGQIDKEITPLMTAHLLAGDWLYLPARWWHAAIAREHSLSISIGVMDPEPSR